MLLRLTASGLLVTTACNNLLDGDASLLSVSMIILSIFLTLGLFTVAVSGLAAMLIMTLSLLLHQGTQAASTVTVPVCLALALLGAGAYSLDARLFGQRRVVWPNH
jgi:hypothetical protein